MRTARAKPSGGGGPRPGRRVGGRLAHGSRRRDGRRSCRPAAARGGAGGRELRSRARDAARRHLPGRGRGEGTRAARRADRRGAPDAAQDRAQGAREGLMAITADTETRLVVQGITGREGSFHATRNKQYGTNVVAGVTPGKGGEEVE